MSVGRFGGLTRNSIIQRNLSKDGKSGLNIWDETKPFEVLASRPLTRSAIDLGIFVVYLRYMLVRIEIKTLSVELTVPVFLIWISEPPLSNQV